MKSHIISNFDKALFDLKNTTISMGAGAQKSLNNAMLGLLKHDNQMCNQAIVDDDDQDRLEIEIDKMGINVIVRFQPLAGDLRMVIISMKTAGNFERISDHAVSIAKRARKVLQSDKGIDYSDIEPLYEFVGTMLADAIKAYTDGDIELTKSVILREKSLKKTHKIASRIYSKKLEEEHLNHRDYLDLVFICRWLERVGSLAVNIAEDVIFEETSNDVRHGGGLPPSSND